MLPRRTGMRWPHMPADSPRTARHSWSMWVRRRLTLCRFTTACRFLHPGPTGIECKAQELVYTGVRRTPICALLGLEVAAEFFATTQDAYLRLGMVPESPRDLDTADGRPATVDNAHSRLSRMLGGDADLISVERTRTLANKAFVVQRRTIADAIRAVAARLPGRVATTVLSGSGEFLGGAAVESALADSSSIARISLADRLGTALSTAACAYAIAVLSSEEQR